MSLVLDSIESSHTELLFHRLSCIYHTPFFSSSDGCYWPIYGERSSNILTFMELSTMSPVVLPRQKSISWIECYRWCTGLSMNRWHSYHDSNHLLYIALLRWLSVSGVFFITRSFLCHCCYFLCFLCFRYFLLYFKFKIRINKACSIKYSKYTYARLISESLFLCIILPMTGSSPRCPLCSHYMLCRNNHSCFLVISPLTK